LVSCVLRVLGPVLTHRAHSLRGYHAGTAANIGAGAPHLLRLVMSHGLALTAGGVILGGTAALVLTRLLRYLLRGEPV